MKKYELTSKSSIPQLERVFCNKCGREILVENGIVKEGIYESKNEWGYFSRKDREIHSFDICEECYNKIISEFIIPIDIDEKKEVL